LQNRKFHLHVACLAGRQGSAGLWADSAQTNKETQLWSHGSKPFSNTLGFE
jgi:hypothetical protein